jgi:hypothetical protein
MDGLVAGGLAVFALEPALDLPRAEPNSPSGSCADGTSTRSDLATPGRRESSPRAHNVLIMVFTLGAVVPK